MEVRYPCNEWDRGGAWRHLLKNKPVIEIDGHKFSPRDHHFRKNHEYRHSWGWFVTKWVSETCTERPSKAPDPHEQKWGNRIIPYVWATWVEYDGAEVSGFVLETEAPREKPPKPETVPESPEPGHPDDEPTTEEIHDLFPPDEDRPT